MAIPILLLVASLALLALLAIAIACLLHYLFFFFVVSGHRLLPPGSMGWPYIGETLTIYSQRPGSFFTSKQRRYGDVFKTHILGCPCVVVASPQAIKFVLVSRAQLFKPTFPASKQAMIGREAFMFHDGAYHARLRRLLQLCLSPDALRRLSPAVDRLVLATLTAWRHDSRSPGKIINTFAEMKKLTFRVGVLVIFGEDDHLDMEAVDRAYAELEQGYNCMPIDVPGTRFYRAMKARRHLRKIVEKEIIRRRREGRGGGLLEKLMMVADAEDASAPALNLDQIVDNVIGLVFASRDTTASVLTWVVKFLKTGPSGLLESVTAEQELIRRKKGDAREGLTWEDTKNMPLTARVFQETMRMATVLSFTFREAVEDVEYKGYVIPKGWKVLPLFQNIHHNPDFFPEPLKFDPSRFEAPLKPNTFLPFGSGIHACPGNELARLEVLIFVHHLITKIRWELDGCKNGVQYSPFQIPEEGLPIRIEPKEES